MSLLNKTHVTVDSNYDALASFSSWGLFWGVSDHLNFVSAEVDSLGLVRIYSQKTLLHQSCFDFCTFGLSNECKQKQSTDQSFSICMLHSASSVIFPLPSSHVFISALELRWRCVLLWKNTGRPCVAVNLLTHPLDDIKAEQKKLLKAFFVGAVVSEIV